MTGVLAAYTAYIVCIDRRIINTNLPALKQCSEGSNRLLTALKQTTGRTIARAALKQCAKGTRGMLNALKPEQQAELAEAVLKFICRAKQQTARLNWARRASWGWRDEWDGTASRHKNQNSSPGGLMPSTYFSVTEAPSCKIKSLRMSGEETFCVLETWRPEWGSNRLSQTF